MTERTFEDIELDLKLFQIKLDNAENSKRLLQKLKNDVMELQIELGEIKKDTYESIISGLSNASAALLKEVAKSKLTDTARLLM